MFFLPSTSANTPLALMVVITCNLRWCFFFLGALAHLLMCTQTNRHTLQLALCGSGCSIQNIYTTPLTSPLPWTHLNTIKMMTSWSKVGSMLKMSERVLCKVYGCNKQARPVIKDCSFLECNPIQRYWSQPTYCLCVKNPH